MQKLSKICIFMPMYKRSLSVFGWKPETKEKNKTYTTPKRMHHRMRTTNQQKREDRWGKKTQQQSSRELWNSNNDHKLITTNYTLYAFALEYNSTRLKFFNWNRIVSNGFFSLFKQIWCSINWEKMYFWCFRRMTKCVYSIFRSVHNARCTDKQKHDCSSERRYRSVSFSIQFNWIPHSLR